jgi:hypothetical protein
MPTMIIVAPKKNRIARLVGQFDIPTLGVFTSGVISGSVQTIAVPNIPSLEIADCSTIFRGTEAAPEVSYLLFITMRVWVHAM